MAEWIKLNNVVLQINIMTNQMEMVELTDEEMREYDEERQRHWELTHYVVSQKHASSMTKKIMHKAHNKLNRKFKIQKNPIYTLSKLKNRFQKIFTLYKHYITHLRNDDKNDPLYYYSEYWCTYLLDLMKKINSDIKCVENRFKIDHHEFIQECYKPSRIFYQISIDPDYLDN
jgi:hypothetical protein